ncbi:MAG: UMP kinase, partial [Planctomycetota bacterium]|nr:UMP kinase [Planctomycetota bacterium]
MAAKRPRFERLLLKLSGEAFCRPGGYGIDPEELRLIASEIGKAAAKRVQLAVVVGGGNIIRGGTLAKAGQIH